MHSNWTLFSIMSDIIVFDQLADIKRLTTDESFILLEKRFQKERARMLGKMLDRDTNQEETLALKAVINSLEGVSPMALAEKILKIEVKNRKVESPEFFKLKRKR